METKRILLATALCLLIMIGWGKLSEYMGWTPPPAQLQEQAQTTQVNNQTSQTIPSQISNFAPKEGKIISIDTPLYTASIHSSGAIISSFKLKNYPELLGSNQPFEMVSPQAALVSPMGILYNGQPTWHTAQWQIDTQDNILLKEGETKTITFIGTFNDTTLKRTLTFDANTYLIKENLETIASTNQSARLSFTLAATTLSSSDNSYDTMKVAYDTTGLETNEDVSELTETGFIGQNKYKWAGLASNYFLSAVAPVSTSLSTLKARIEGSVWRVALEESDVFLQANQSHFTQNYWWFGPKSNELLALAPQDLVSATDLGFFDLLARPMLWVMTFLYNFVGNWGISIILLTILIKLLFWPLTRSSYTSMQKMKQVQPMMKDLQERYKDDKEALSREMMQLYRTYGVNPLGGCLPILVQIPVFFALYQALLQSLELRHSSFITYLPFTDILWLADLSAKDPLYITPILMGGSMFVQQLLTPSMGDPTQRKIMLAMPVIFTFMFLNFPSGLVVYWLMSNIVGIGQQWYTLRNIK